ncbi:clavesin-1 [Maniola hyperantus]|uniref:clavesin-1 n=1 Tax=Aphantopus hyperantus TaxID=2795564 RepID=UPI0015680D6B|nr:clavesin-1 [Maniola hyperantus]XP_034839360.1 clavesin-1 [Maniola hyperantus]
MTTASVLLTVSTTWGANSDICDKDERVGRSMRNVAAVAARELRETPSTRDQALRIMRDWIEQNADIKNVRTDESFLLRFLRHKKYSIPMAQQTLLKYLSLRKFYPSVFTKLDSEDPTLSEIISNGYIAVSPVRDNKGRRVIVYNMGKFNAVKFNCWDMCRAHIIVYEALMEDSTDQIFGFTHVGDGSGSTTAHVTSWNPIDFARLLKWGEQSLPMRHKEFQLVNVPAALKYIIDFATSKVSNKMSERLHIHTNIKNLQSNVDLSCLPTAYGGHIPLQDMIKFTKDLLAEKRNHILALDDMVILNTKGIVSTRKPGNALKADAVSVEGSFRKLEID